MAFVGDALAERLFSGHADDLVRPYGVDASEKGAGEGGAEDGLAREEIEGAVEEGEDEAVEERVHNVNSVSPEAREAAGVGDQVADGGADGGGDGLLVDEGNRRAGFKECLFLAFFGGRLLG